MIEILINKSFGTRNTYKHQRQVAAAAPAYKQRNRMPHSRRNSQVAVVYQVFAVVVGAAVHTDPINYRIN